MYFRFHYWLPWFCSPFSWNHLVDTCCGLFSNCKFDWPCHCEIFPDSLTALVSVYVDILRADPWLNNGSCTIITVEKSKKQLSTGNIHLGYALSTILYSLIENLKVCSLNIVFKLKTVLVHVEQVFLINIVASWNICTFWRQSELIL